MPNDNLPASRPQDPSDHGDARSATLVTSGWIGPLPDPHTLREFDNIVPGGAARIFEQFESEGKHRREMESKETRYSIREGHIAQALAGLYGFGALALTAYVAYLGYPTVAVIFGTTTIVDGIVAFLKRS